MVKKNLRLLAVVLILAVIVAWSAGCASPASQPVPAAEPTPAQPSQKPAVPSPARPVEKPEVGFAAPSFSLSDLDGKSFSLNDLRGKRVVLFFWVIDCKECIRELPALQEFYEKKGGSDISVITISSISSADTIRSFTRQHNYTFPVLIDEDTEVILRYERGAPTTFFLDENGIILLIKDDVFTDVRDIEEAVSQAYR